MRSSGSDRFRIALLLSAVASPISYATSSSAQEKPAETQAAAVDAARERYRVGVEAFRSGRFREAIAAFSQADRIAPRPALSHNIAIAYEKLGEHARALEHYRNYLFRDPAVDNGFATRQRIAALEKWLEQRGVQQVSVRSEPSGASVYIDDHEVGITPWTGELVPGRHSIAVVAGSHARETREFELPPDNAIDLDFWLGASDGSPRPVRTQSSDEAAVFAGNLAPPSPGAEARAGLGPLPWVTLALGGAALGTSVVFELQRRNTEDDVSRASQLEYEDRYADMEAQKNTARIFAGVGAALLVAGGVMVVIDRNERRTTALNCAPAGCLVQTEHRF